MRIKGPVIDSCRERGGRHVEEGGQVIDSYKGRVVRDLEEGYVLFECPS